MRKYDKEFKREAVKKIHDGQSVAGVSRELGVSANQLHGSKKAMFQDKFTRRIIGWAIAEHMRAELVVDALRMALRRGLIKRGAIIHTDRGSQYVSNDYRRLLARCGLRQSMSGKGNCYDNAQAESFFSRFKTELVEGGVFTSLAEARNETFSYIEGYYNRTRLHSSLGYLSPIEFETWLRKFDNYSRIDIQNELTQFRNQPVKRRRAMLASNPSRNNRPGTHRQMNQDETTNNRLVHPTIPLSIDSPMPKKTQNFDNK